MTYEEVHAGDHVLGHDGEVWGVAEIDHAPTLRVVLVRLGYRVQGWPPAGTPVTIVHRADTSAEMHAFDVLAGAGFDLQLLGERYAG